MRHKVSVTVCLVVAVCTLFSGCVEHGEGNAAQKNARQKAASKEDDAAFAGSSVCRECHKDFHRLWATSHHGLAMQPFTSGLAQRELNPQTKPIKIGDCSYQAHLSSGGAYVTEEGPKQKKRYPIEHVMGGKNIYYFLTPLKRGWLQVLPVAYDVHRKEWYNTTASAVRHFPDMPDEALHWTERPYTFNTSCYSCHVSQLSTNYHIADDSYHTVWAEPGINCETCHGPSAGHIEVCRNAPEGEVPEDIRIIKTSVFAPKQLNDMCAPCHAKMSAVTTTFQPGDRYFDHYDLVTLEDPDFYPDGRDLGENYTFTLWRMSPCVRSGELSCSHCHTSSGRFRFKGAASNNACMPCHEERVKTVTEHSRHKADSTGSRCINCHMPMTEFARMKRSDHSMLPPTPQATIQFKSPNACTICHDDQEASWAEAYVKKWYSEGYQNPALKRAEILKAARSGEGKKRSEVLAFLESDACDEIYTASLIRLLGSSQEERIGKLLLKRLAHASPLVRAAAASELRHHLSPETVDALAEVLDDPVRLVRIRAASSLVPVYSMLEGRPFTGVLEKALEEYKASLLVRPDDFASHYNLGNFFMDQGKLTDAVDSFQTALRLQPQAVAVLVNLSMAYARMEKPAEAEACLENALTSEPKSAPANFNMALLKAEQQQLTEAEQYLRAALKADPKMAQAAYNLGILLSEHDLDEAVEWCRKAYRLQPESRSYSYTLAFYLRRLGNREEAVVVLENCVEEKRPWGEHVDLLAQLYFETGRQSQARELYRKALSFPGMPEQYRMRFRQRL